ncbi:Atu4866 domain-containing protein [Leeuwenhoekiella polynyae]|uniref:Putative ligand-binding protein with streptavidin-like fold n=1 Tax=Leeuwenhoekiella polynyae TaxID=1550906 RepID=A0A4Q0NS09_9FLAO|nr:putative ligand-binding protein with streptavidin-like fold [Leeuwenhoekiella polynyae]
MRATKAVTIRKELLANNKYDETRGNREVTFIAMYKI